MALRDGVQGVDVGVPVLVEVVLGRDAHVAAVRIAAAAELGHAEADLAGRVHLADHLAQDVLGRVDAGPAVAVELAAAQARGELPVVLVLDLVVVGVGGVAEVPVEVAAAPAGVVAVVVDDLVLEDLALVVAVRVGGVRGLELVLAGLEVGVPGSRGPAVAAEGRDEMTQSTR